MFRQLKIWIFGISLVFLSSQAIAQDYADALQEMGEEAAQGYLKPFVSGVGVGMNSQWSYTAKTMSFLGLPIGFNAYIGYPIVSVSKSMKTFDFHGSMPIASLLDSYQMPNNLNVDSVSTLMSDIMDTTYDLSAPVTVDAKDIPTIYGSDKKKKTTLAALSGNSPYLALIEDYNSWANDMNHTLSHIKDSMGGELPDSLIPTEAKSFLKANATSLDTIAIPDSITLPFVGINTPIAPTLPPVGVTMGISMIPVLDNITLGIRFLPKIGNDDLGRVGMFGFMVQHELTHLIPVLGKMPFLHFAAYYAQNSFEIEVKDQLSIETTSRIAMLQTSVDLSFLVGLGIYGGIGWEHSKLEATVEELQLTPGLTLPKFSTTIDGGHDLRTQLGLRFSFAVFDLYADVNYGSTTVYNAGLALGLNGL